MSAVFDMYSLVYIWQLQKHYVFLCWAGYPAAVPGINLDANAADVTSLELFLIPRSKLGLWFEVGHWDLYGFRVNV